MILETSWKSLSLSLFLMCLLSKASSQKGSILLIPTDNQVPEIAKQLSARGFKVIRLENNPGLATDPQTLRNAQSTWKSLHTASPNHSSILGIGAGAQLAALLTSTLAPDQQPENLILLSPAPFDQTIPGTVIPLLIPPFVPTARLLALPAPDTSRTANASWSEYVKTWKGYDGYATLRIPNNPTQARNIIDSFLLAGNTPQSSTVTNPATIPVPGWGAQRHAEKIALAQKEKFDLILIGNSITNNFEKPEYQSVWNQFFAPRKTLNLGYSGYRTENILWNIEHGELDGQSPKVVLLEIGTNNVDEKNYPTRHTASQLAGGIQAIANLIRKKLPDTKLILLRPFPGCYGGPNPTSHRAILNRAGDLIARLADNKHIFYGDVNHVFLNFDGTIRHELMPDWLHPNAAGAMAWMQAMEPLLAELMGDTPKTQTQPANTAIIPVTKLEEDSYNWWDRHREVLRIKDSIDPEIILIGNSITHFWGGLPALKNIAGNPRTPNGPISWNNLFKPYRVLNLGFGWDRTQNVLWRLDHGELDGLHPRTVIIDIGTNNTSQTDHARMNTAAEIAEGVQTVCERIRSKIPNTHIILMAIFPREQSPTHPRRQLINETNRLLRNFAASHQLTFVDIGPSLLDPNGVMLPGVTSDFCHPTEKGYEIWAKALKPLL